MPAFLPQFSRRDFLKRALLAGAGLALVPDALAGLLDNKSCDPHTFAFFSDAHIAGNVNDVSRGVNMADHLTAAVRDLYAWPVRPAALFVNGDLAFRDGEPGDYNTFGRLIDPVRALAPLHLSFGNHDERDHFWQAFPDDAAAEKTALNRQAMVIESERVNWFQLDSLDKTASTPGELGSAQLDWLSRELAARPDKPAIIVGHHNLEGPLLQALIGAIGLKDTAALEKVFARHSQVKAYVFGHTHNWHVSQHHTGVHLVNLPPTAYVFNKGRPSGWVRATLAADGAEFELRSLDPTHPENGQIKKLKWRAG